MSEKPGLLDKARIGAAPGFGRWLIPPAALAIHLCIGMAYGFSVFWLPLAHAVGAAQGLDKVLACPAGTSVLTVLTTTACDWPVSMLGWTYTLFFVFLGSSAALFGHWLETAGPRKAGVVAAGVDAAGARCAPAFPRLPRACGPGDHDTAVLAAVGCAVPECQRRHRSARHGLPDAAGSLWRPPARRQ